jgi:WhiB family redox-sensing transcriptional regulator
MRQIHGDTSVAALAHSAAALGRPLPCRDNVQLWFSDRVADLELAKASCRTCALRLACLAGAVERAEPCGVWGGEIFDNGVIIAEKRPRGRPARDQLPCSGARNPVPG